MTKKTLIHRGLLLRKPVGGGALVALASVLLAGCMPESPTGESWSDLEEQCLETGGDWQEVADCPTVCWPLEPPAYDCEAESLVLCPAVCGEQPACSCPSLRSYWEEGVGCVAGGCED